MVKCCPPARIWHGRPSQRQALFVAQQARKRFSALRWESPATHTAASALQRMLLFIAEAFAYQPSEVAAGNAALSAV